jgi:hypothetical protein
MQISNESKMLELEYKINAQEFGPADDHVQSYIFILVTLIFFAFLSIWIMQNSVNAYFQQTYHRESPLSKLEKFEVWTLGGQIGDLLYTKHDLNKAMIGQLNTEIINQYNEHYAYTPEYRQYLVQLEKQEKIRLAKEEQARAHQALLDQFTLTKTDQVFFAGDSLMQGVAPHVQKHLQEKFDIKTINLSKQSTGLSYPSFFDWPKTIQEAISENKQIKVLVVFLGANDPWDMPNPKGGSYLKFQSPEWETVYRSRISQIIQTAKENRISVMWLSPPNMKKDSLNQQMVYLNRVISDEVKKHQAFFIDTRPLLGGKNDIYNEYLTKNGNSIKMRSVDGIHFSTDGQKLIAQVISSHLKIIH